ncbi:MAG: helix-turn-helix transcriptional regulator [Nocardioidaceae bacterium]|nr:helix-turn-helix transcriptional regulator [Nocardioidaceae bacterium]
MTARTRKSYEQYCGIAVALDRIGDRWTLLILRELSFGPHRFTDLRSALPGIASNLLTERLRDLEEYELVEQRELPAPAARVVYALTPQGRRIIPVLRALARFGLPMMADPVDGEVKPRHAIFGGFGALFEPLAALDVELRIRFLLDGEEHWLEVSHGRLVRPDTSAQPDLTIEGTAAALVELCQGADEASLVPRLRIAGSAQARRDLEQVFLATATTLV